MTKKERLQSIYYNAHQVQVTSKHRRLCWSEVTKHVIPTSKEHHTNFLGSEYNWIWIDIFF